MCAFVENAVNNYGEFGCMLEISRCEFMPDGRALVETVGKRRFRVKEKSIKDGYNVANVEWISDIEITNEEEKIGMIINFRLFLIDSLYNLTHTHI